MKRIKFLRIKRDMHELSSVLNYWRRCACMYINLPLIIVKETEKGKRCNHSSEEFSLSLLSLPLLTEIFALFASFPKKNFQLVAKRRNVSTTLSSIILYFLFKLSSIVYYLINVRQMSILKTLLMETFKEHLCKDRSPVLCRTFGNHFWKTFK